MKRNFVLMLAALGLLLGLAACNDAAPKIAVIDAEKLYENSDLAKQGMAYVEGLNNTFSQRVAEMREEMTAKPDDEALGLKLQEELMGLQQTFQTEQTQAAEKLNKLFEEVVEEYRQQHKLEAILPKQAVLAVRPEADVTDAVGKLFDSKSVQFGPAPAPAPAEQPAAPAEAPDSAPDAAAGAEQSK